MVLDRHLSDLYIRPSWLNAALALNQIEKVFNAHLIINSLIYVHMNLGCVSAHVEATSCRCPSLTEHILVPTTVLAFKVCYS